MRILGIDPGYGIVGYGIIEGGQAGFHYRLESEDTSKWIWVNESNTDNENYPIGSKIEQETSPGDGWVNTNQHPKVSQDYDNSVLFVYVVLQSYIRMDTENEYDKMVQDKT